MVWAEACQAWEVVCQGKSRVGELIDAQTKLALMIFLIWLRRMPGMGGMPSMGAGAADDDDDDDDVPDLVDGNFEDQAE